ncbi:uncharacterized protein LOC117640017 isoform X3 [Thrips palmi]|uniref:Uncharacterized protein LOC117640017 isoform X3 n=1 Tax=Thrips palmi TaxID=161013 RepID=A0A6P8Y7P5_THRPL|nr:uncharacterized protein LOC117640017 isoform X3 [Thrips palmi]
MNASETRVPSFTNESFELVEDEAEHPLGVSALVSRLNCSSAGSDAGSQASLEGQKNGPAEQGPEKNFPWLTAFSKHCRSAIGSKSMKQLDDLLAIYLEHVTAHYLDCHKLPNKAAKLKRNINDTMIFFHMLYMDIREPLENAFYYDKMTELVAMYLDLEITASRRGKDTEKTVTNKLSTSLYTFLDHSEDHILDALLKTKLINKHSKKVCVPLLRKILSELVVRRPLAELTYVRFLLSFKLWKNVVEDVEERRAINKLAAQRLHPPPEYFLDHDIAKHNTEVLPRVPKNKKNCTLFYLGANFSVKGACYAFFRYCKDTNRANVYRRNIPVSEEIEKPFLISSRSSHRNNDAEESGSCSLINDIWSTISNGDSSSNLLGESDMFSEVHEEERNESLGDEASKKDKPHDSPDSGIDTSDRNQRKDIRKKKEPVPVTKFVMIKTESVVDPIPASSPAKGVQDCCLGSVFMMEQVNKVGGGHGHSKADVCESELPTSSRQHSVLESLVYTQPGSDNEAVASSSVSPKAGTVQTSHLDTNECDSSVEILQSRQISTDVSLPLQLKPSLNIDEELRSDKASKEDLLLFTGSDPVADDGGGVFESPFSDFNMFRDDLFTCRSFEDQPSMMYRRTDVTGSLPFQGSPLLEEDEEDFRSFRWTGVPDYASIQSTIINQSSGTSSTSDLTSCYGGVESKTTPEDNEEPKLGHDLKSGKGSTQGLQRNARTSRRQSEQATIDSTCGGVLADLGLGSTALESDLVDLGLDDLGLEKALSGGLDENLTGEFDASSGDDENIVDAGIEVAQPSTKAPKRPASDVRRGRPPKRRGSNASQPTAVASTTSPSNHVVVPKKPRHKATSICAMPLTRSIADAVGIRLPDPIQEVKSKMATMRKQQSKKSVL